LSEPRWCALLGGDMDELADAVLDLIVHRSTTTARIPKASSTKSKPTRRAS
jgi:hypothetical protein